MNKGIEGEYYSTMNWNELSEDHVSTGEFTTPFSFDFGYNVYNGFVIGAGVGYGLMKKFVNCYDPNHILGYNGYYYKMTNSDRQIDAKGYLSYYIPSDNWYSIYFKFQYSIIMGPSISIGFAL